MGKIVLSENITLDGVIQDPTGEEGREFGGWFDPATAPDGPAWAATEEQEALAATALLLGRRTYEYLAARFPSRAGVWAERLNSMPKYVVSTTLDDPGWSNSMILAGDPAIAVPTLRDATDGDIVVYASGRLAATLLRHDLVDELRLMVHPVVVGAGTRLFGPGRADLRLAGTRTIGSGLVLLTYERPQ